MIRILIVEDNSFILRYLTNLVESREEFCLAGTLRDAFQAEKLCCEEKIDVVLMDVQTLHNHSGLTAGEQIRKNHPSTKVIIVTSLVDPEILSRARSGAADSLWYKDHGDEELGNIILRTVSGERIFPDSSPSVELRDMFSSDISPRQIEILRRFIKGMTYEEIAEELDITKNGVRWNLDRLVEKGGFANKHELLAAVIENKLIVTTLKENVEC